MDKDEIKNVSENLLSFLSLMQNRFFKPCQKVMKDDLNPTQFRILKVLKEKKVMTMSELAKEVLVSKQQLTPAIDKLICNNIIMRQHDEDDRRIIRIMLTSNGIELLEKHKTLLIQVISDKLEELESQEIEKLNCAIDDIFQVISKIDS